MTAAPAFISLTTVGWYYTCIDKNYVLMAIDRWYYYAAYALPFAFVVSVVGRNWLIVAISGVFLLADLYVGFRANSAICFLALSMFYGASLFKWPGGTSRYLAVAGVCIFSIFFIKQAMYPIKAYGDIACQVAIERDIELAKAGLQPPLRLPRQGVAPIDHGDAGLALQHFGKTLSTAAPYIAALTESEPFVTQSILNEVVRQGFQTESGYIGNQLLSGVPGGKTLFGIDVSGTPTFNDLFQNQIFPTIKTYSVANNPWAQAYAAGGYVGVSILAVVFSSALCILSALFWSTSGISRAVIAVISTWTAFYFHRNDFMTEIGILKQVIYTAVFAGLFAFCVSVVRSKVNRYLERFSSIWSG
jgi:hypothetical protein